MQRTGQKCVVVIRVFFGLWHFKLAESTKFLREGYLANQLEKAVIDVQLMDVLSAGSPARCAFSSLSAVSPAPSGVDEGRSEESMSAEEAEALVDQNSREWADDVYFRRSAQDKVGDGKNNNSTAQSKSEVQHLRNQLRPLALSSNHPSMKVPEGGRLSI